MTRYAVLLLTTVALLGAVHSDRAHAQEPLFYFVNAAERVELVPSSRTVAVRTAAESAEAFERFVREREAVVTLRLPQLRDRYGIYLLRAREEAGDSESERALDEIRQAPMVESDVRVFESGAIELLFVGTYKVRFTADATASEINSTLAGIGADNVDERDADSGRYVFEIPAAPFEAALERINRISALDIVRYAQPDFVRVYPPRLGPETALRTVSESEDGQGFVLGSRPPSECDPQGSLPADPGLPQDPMFENQWSLRNEGNNPLPGKPGADVRYVDAIPSASAGDVRIAILDLGVDASHDDLQSVVVEEHDATESGGPGPQHGSNYHGTRVAGIAGAQVGNEVGVTGIARSAKLISIRIARAACATCSWITLGGSEWRGIRKAVEREAGVIVNSWAEAGGGFDSDIYAEIKDAVESGVVVVFAAGNHIWEIHDDEFGIPKITQGPAEVMFPASLAATAPDTNVRAGLIAVSATNQFDELKTHAHEQQTTISQDGDTGWGSNRGPAVSIAAPGVHLYTTDIGGEYACFSGTSAAAPLVGGAAAILKNRYPDATPAQIKHWLQAGADKLYLAEQDEERDDFIGHGRLDLAGAVEAADAETGRAERRPEPPELLTVN